jgi:hypothetical protein
MTEEHKRSIKTARLTGVWYLIMAISGIVGFVVLHSRIFDLAEPETTLNNLIGLRAIARTRLVFELAIIVSQALAAVWFYKLFIHIDRWAATTLGIWGTVNATIITVSAISMSSAIAIADSSALSLQQKIPLIELLTEVISSAWSIGGLFFGLWLIPMGYMVVSSNRMPLWLGRILIIGGIGYLVQTVLKSLGIQSPYAELLVVPATIGEFWMIGYLLVFGIRPESVDGQP